MKATGLPTKRAMRIDLNCDLGEGGTGDAAIMAWITSANIACGAHAGGVRSMVQALEAAKTHGVQVGAHPGYFDREHLGRRELALDEAEVFEACLYQVGALAALARATSQPIRYLKPHGGLYHQACRYPAYARPVIRAARQFDLAIMGLPDSELQRQCSGLRFIAEGFADRRYQADGSLVPRGEPHAFIEAPRDAVEQVEWLIRDRGVQTLCVHGDNPRALEFVRTLREELTANGFAIEPF